MHKYQLLRLRAEELRVVLEEYAQRDDDVADFLRRWLPWYEKVKKREIRLPCYEYGLGIYFTNPDLSPLARRYGFMATLKSNSLADAHVEFSAAIHDRLSQAWYLNQLKAAGEEPRISLDELPPSDEEIPIAEASESTTKQGWLNALIFGRK